MGYERESTIFSATAGIVAQAERHHDRACKSTFAIVPVVLAAGIAQSVRATLVHLIGFV
jgi:hypothetical protein